MKARTATDRRAPSACAGPAPGDRAAAAARSGAAGAGDRLFLRLGNGGYDVAHYGLTLDYVPETNHLRGTAVITARATQDLSRSTSTCRGCGCAPPRYWERPPKSSVRETNCW